MAFRFDNRVRSSGNRSSTSPIPASTGAAPAPRNTVGDRLMAVLTSPAQQEQFRRALGNMIPVERFIRISQTALRQTPKLDMCSPESFLASLMQAAQLGLEPNTPQGLCYLVPYWSNTKRTHECQLIVGYKGLLALMWRSGMVSSINADVVYRQEVEQGLFSFESGMNACVHHKINLLNNARSGKDEDIVAAYACARLKTGQTIVKVVPRQDIDKVNTHKDAWVNHFQAMALKTAIIRLAKLVPTAAAVAEAVAIEEKNAAVQAAEMTGTVVDMMTGEVTVPTGPDMMDTPAQLEAIQEESAQEEPAPQGGGQINEVLPDMFEDDSVPEWDAAPAKALEKESA